MTKPCTIDPDKPCQGCMLRGTSLKAKVSGSLDARFLVVTNPPTEKRLVDKENMTKGGMQVFAANMEKCGFDAQDFMFMPYIRCHFDEDQLTTREKSDIRKHCVHWLAQTAEHFNPEVIIPLGVEPSKAVYGRGVKLGKIRGIADHVEGFDQLVMTLTDPGSIFFRPEHEPIFASDCRTLERLVKYDYDKEAAAEQVLGEYETVTDLQFLIDNPPEVLAFDTETTGLRWYEPNKILTMQFTTAPGNGYMVVWDHPEKPFPRRLRKKLKQQLKQVLQNPNTSVVGQNLKFDALFVWKHFGFRFRIDDDTLMLAAIVDENAQTKDLDTLTKLYAPEMAGYADAFNAKWDKSRMDLVPLDELEGYGCGDTDACLRVYYALMSIVDQDEGLYQTYRRVSIPGINAFYGLEPRGLNVNGPALDDLQEVLTESVREQNISLMSRVDKAIKRKHITSAKDPKDRAKAVSWSRKEFMIDVLFKHPKGFLLKPSVFTAKTQHLADPSRRVPSCSSKEHLPYFFEEEPFTEELTAYIKDERLLSTNVVSFRNKYIHRGKVYPSYSLWTAVTGRTASCVKNDTPVVTRRGVVPADSVVVGDMVWTHKLRWQPVLELYIKPVTLMYSLHLSNGEVLTCTGQHKVLLFSSEWVTVDSLLGLMEQSHASCEQAPYARSEFSASRSKNVQRGDADYTASSRHTQREQRHGDSDDHSGFGGKSIQDPQEITLRQKQTEREEPTVREAVGIELRGWPGLPDKTHPGQALLCSSNSNGQAFGYEALGFAGRDGGPSYRRGSTEQFSGQLGADNQSRSCETTRTVPNNPRGCTIEKIECAGSHRVYDFEVAQDHSYLACGIFNHNSDPNGQNFPKRGKLAKAYRKIFVPPPGRYMLEADLSQAELRFAAESANEKVMLEIYQNGGDIHTITAAVTMGIDPDVVMRAKKDYTTLLLDVANDWPGSGVFLRGLSSGKRKKATVADFIGFKRFQAKAINFGFIYGMGWRKFIGYAKTQYGIEFTEAEAQETRRVFFQTYPGLAPWHDRVRSFAKKNKYVRSFSGRVRHLPMIDSKDEMIAGEASRQAVNSPIQEFASSLGVMSMGRIDAEVDPEYMALTAFVHDALYAYCWPQHIEWAAKTMKYYMESNPLKDWFGLKLHVPIIADVGFGLNGGETHEMGDLELDKPFDFDSIPQLDIDVPEQVIPPNNGRIIQPEHLHIRY